MLGMAAPSMKTLFVGAVALGLSLVIAFVSFVNAARRADRDLYASFGTAGLQRAGPKGRALRAEPGPGASRPASTV